MELTIGGVIVFLIIGFACCMAMRAKKSALGQATEGGLWPFFKN